MIEYSNMEHWARVRAFAASVSPACEAALLERMEYLARYANEEGCTYERRPDAATEPEREGTRCVVTPDLGSPDNVVLFTMYCRGRDGQWALWFDGCVAHHGATSWGVHT